MGFVLDVAGYGTRAVPDRDGDAGAPAAVVVTTTLSRNAGCNSTMRAVDHQWTGDGINARPAARHRPAGRAQRAAQVIGRRPQPRTTRATADRIRLRMAIGVGLIRRRAPSRISAGPVIVDNNETCRQRRAASPRFPPTRRADLAVALSGPGVHPDRAARLPRNSTVGQFAHVRTVAAKEFSGTAWIWRPPRQWSEPAYLPLGATDPREIAGYRIVARLGSGQAGQVYLASGAFSGGGFSDADPGWAALKLFDQRLAADPAVRRRLSLRRARGPGRARAWHVASAHRLRRPTTRQDRPVGGEHPGAVGRWPRSWRRPGGLPARRTVGWIALTSLARSPRCTRPGSRTTRSLRSNVLLDAHGPVLTRPRASAGTHAALRAEDSPTDDVLMLGATMCSFAATGYSPWSDGSAPHGRWHRPRPVSLLADPDLSGCPSCAAARSWPRASPADPAARPSAARSCAHGWQARSAPGRRPGFPTGRSPRGHRRVPGAPPSRGRFRWPRRRDL